MTYKSLVVKRLISATCQEVFAAWSQAELMSKWFYPARSGWKSTASNEFKVGGHYELIMIAEDGTTYLHTGIYKEIISNQKIVFTWNSDSIKNTLVTIELRPVDNKTEITLTHELLPNEEQYESHQGGWNECLDNLKNFLGKKDYQCEISYQAPIEKVYQAITNAEGLRSWWTKNCAIGPVEINSISTFHFGANYKIMKIKSLAVNKEIIWECIEQYYADQNFTKNNEWVGTQIIFSLMQNSHGSTSLNFKHKGLTQTLECYDICQKGWDYFLKESLKAYLETGIGKPY